MTIASEIQRLQEAKASMQTSIWNKWVAIPSSAKLDDYAWYIDQIQTCGWDDILSYMSWVLSLDWPTIYISWSDSVNNKYGDYSWKDWEYIYLVKPYEYDNYSSSWASHMETYASCTALRKWASSTSNYNPEMYQWWYYTTTHIDYYYINWNSISFYWRTWEYRDTYWCVTLTCNNWSWSMSSSGWWWVTPPQTWWNQNLFYSSVDGCLSHNCNFHYKWRPR